MSYPLHTPASDARVYAKLLLPLSCCIAARLDNNSESSANSLPLFAMSGDGQTDIMIPMVFLFGVEAAHLMDVLRVHSDLVLYVGETAKPSSTSLHPLVPGRSGPAVA